MALLGIDLGGTKLAMAVFSREGEILYKESIPLQERKGTEVGTLITNSFLELQQTQNWIFDSIGISVPGIFRPENGTVWAPNIPGWENYPLLNEFKKSTKNIPITIDSDRACCILGELWKGNAQECKDAIFLTVGTGIGAGIIINGQVFRGANDIAGAIGWMAIQKPFKDKYIACGCFEYSASGHGILRLVNELLKEYPDYAGELKNSSKKLTASFVFDALENDDEIARHAIDLCIEDWGMAAANLVSLFNPEKIIFGGGVFGPAIPLIPQIKSEAEKWAQPVSMRLVKFEASALKSHAGLYGAAYLALKNISA